MHSEIWIATLQNCAEWIHYKFKGSLRTGNKKQLFWAATAFREIQMKKKMISIEKFFKCSLVYGWWVRWWWKWWVPVHCDGIMRTITITNEWMNRGLHWIAMAVAVPFKIINSRGLSWDWSMFQLLENSAACAMKMKLHLIKSSTLNNHSMECIPSNLSVQERSLYHENASRLATTFSESKLH